MDLKEIEMNIQEEEEDLEVEVAEDAPSVMKEETEEEIEEEEVEEEDLVEGLDQVVRREVLKISIKRWMNIGRKLEIRIMVSEIEI